jgi:hypothetical protein
MPLLLSEFLDLGKAKATVPSFKVLFAWRISFVHLAAWPCELVDADAV